MKKKRNILIATGMVFIVLILIVIDIISTNTRKTEYPQADALIKPYAKEHGLKLKDWPDELRLTLEKNPETKEFVLNYPLKKGTHEDFTISENEFEDTIPYFMQWDSRWGYEDYAGSSIGIAGCGPVCLSMVTMHLLQDSKYDPLYIAKFAQDNNFATEGNGTKWILMSEGAEMLGLKSEELPLDKNVMVNALFDGKPIILIMGAGDFTSSGHYIILTGYQDGGFRVLDPNSKERSEKIWTYEKIEGQIRNIWAFEKK